MVNCWVILMQNPGHGGLECGVFMVMCSDVGLTNWNHTGGRGQNSVEVLAVSLPTVFT